MSGKCNKSIRGSSSLDTKSHKSKPRSRPPQSASPGKRPRISSPKSSSITNKGDGTIWTVDLSQLFVAASRNDIRSVRSCLLDESDGSTVSRRDLTSRGVKSLMPSTNVAKALHALLFDKDYTEANSIYNINFSNKEVIKKEYGSAIRSLLLLPPWSVTPWNAASDTISSVQTGTIGGAGQTQILTHIADISMFLSSVGSINDGNAKPDSYCGQCERLRSLFHQIIEPLFQPIEDIRSEDTPSLAKEENRRPIPKKNLHYNLLMELLPTVLSAARRLDQRSIGIKDNLKSRDQRAINRKNNLKSREKHKGGEQHLKEDGIGTSLHPNMMHALFPISYNNNDSKGNGSKCTMELKERKIRPEMMLHLLTASYDLGQHHHMRSNHWLFLHRKITYSLRQLKIPTRDLPGLMQQVFVSIEAASIPTSQSNTAYLTQKNNMLSSTEWNSDINDGAILSSWYTLLLNIYLASSKCNQTLGKVEAVLKSTMSNLPSRIASLFLDFTVQAGKYLEKEKNFPLWVRANMSLIIYQSQRNGLHSVCKLISDAVGNASGSGVDMIYESLNTLSILPFVDRSLGSLLASSSYWDKHTNDREALRLEMENVKMYLKNVFYAYDGNVGNLRKEADELSENDLGDKFSAYATLVHTSLFLGHENKEARNIDGGCLESHTSERAQMWVNVAFTLMKSVGKQINHSFAHSLLMSTSVLATVFWEVPSSRVSIVRDLRNIISGSLGANNTARNSLELKLNYCLVLSVIVTSADSQPRAEYHQQMHANIDEMDDYLHDCLSPIANLLTCSNMTAVSPTILILELMHALSSLTVGREAILAMVQKHSQITFGSCSFWLTNSSDDAPAGQDGMSLVVEGLICLIRDDRCTRNTWDDDAVLDDTGLEALCSITNLLVSDKPTLSFQVRRLLLQKLLAVVEEGVIHQWTQLRLMGAALVLYLSYFRSTSTLSSGEISLQLSDLQFVPENNLSVWIPFTDNSDSGINMNEFTSIREDLPSLTRLILCLLRSDTDKRRASNKHPSSLVKINEEDFQALFDVIIPRKRVPVESKGSRRQSSFSGKILMPIAFSCVRAVLNYLVKEDFYRHVDNLTFSIAMGSCSELQRAICRTEEKQWSDHSRRGGGRKPLVPSWVNSFSSTNLDSFNQEYSVNNLRSISLILSSMCSIMSGFLLNSVYVPVSKSKKEDKMRVRNLFRLSHSVNILLDTKRNFVIKKTLGHSCMKRDVLDEGSMLALVKSEQEYCSVITFFDCSREVLQITLFDEDISHSANVLAVVSLMIPAIIDYCHYIDSTIRKRPFGSIGCELHLTLRPLWDFYTAICSENGCIRFIEFLELHCLNSNQYVQLKSRDKKKNSISLAESITSHDDIDNYIRQIRSPILSCIRTVFSILTKSLTRNKNKQGAALQVIRRYHIDFMFCIQAICLLSRDLYSGLNGHSGGITKSIYEVYVKIIEDGAKSAYEGCDMFFAGLICDKDSHKQVQDVKEICQSTSILLWNTICNFDVIYPRLFKSLVQSSMWYLPQIVRRIDCLLLPPSAFTLQQLSNSQNIDNGYLAAAMIHQCLEALQIELKEKHGSKHKKRNSKVSTKQDNSLVINSTNTLQAATISIPERCVNVRFPDAKLRNWTFSCSIMVAERVWTDSRSLMIQSRDATSSKCAKEMISGEFTKQIKVTWQSTTRHYASKRRIEVRSILNILNSLFVPIVEDITLPSVNSSEHDISILAELLPQLGKQRLCSCLEKISLTLNHSLKYISRWWREIHLSDLPLSHEGKKYTDMVMAEALACLLAWVSPIESGLSVVDFTIGARTWYSMEKKRESLLKSGLDNSKPGEDSILGRITKLLLRIEELDQVFRKTYLILKGEDFQTNMKNNLLNLDKMVFDVLDGTDTEKENDERCLKTFGQIICAHTERINLMKLSAPKILSKTEPKKIGKVIDVTLQPSQEIRKNKRRSRNGVVDDWLEMDEEWNEDGDSNKNDAFLDLEDFLVDG